MNSVIKSKHDQTAEDYKIRFLNSEKLHNCSCASLYPPHFGGKSFNGISLLNNQFCFLQKSRQGFLKLENSFVFPTRKCFIVFDKKQIHKMIDPFNPKISSHSPYCLPYNSWDVSAENLVFITNPLIDIFLNSHHLSGWYCIDIVRRGSVLVTCGSERVKDIK